MNTLLSASPVRLQGKIRSSVVDLGQILQKYRMDLRSLSQELSCRLALMFHLYSNGYEWKNFLGVDIDPFCLSGKSYKNLVFNVLKVYRTEKLSCLAIKEILIKAGVASNLPISFVTTATLPLKDKDLIRRRSERGTKAVYQFNRKIYPEEGFRLLA